MSAADIRARKLADADIAAMRRTGIRPPHIRPWGIAGNRRGVCCGDRGCAVSPLAVIVLEASARGLSPLEIVAETGISKSVVYDALGSVRAPGSEEGRGYAYTCPRDWPADPEKYREGVAAC